MNRRRTIIVLALIFFLALIVRIAILAATYTGQGSGGVTYVSVSVAENIAQGHGFTNKTPTGYTPNNYELPGYPYFLSIPLAIFGTETGLWVVRIIQMILSSLGIFLCFSIGRRLFKPAIGELFALLWAIFLPEALLSTYLLHDALMPIIALLATYFFVRGALEDKRKYFYFSAICVGMASLIRSDLLLLPIFFFIALMLWNFRHWRRHVVTFFVMVLIITGMLIPWGVRNYREFHKFTILRSVLWQSVWEGFGEFPNPFGAVLDDAVTGKQVEKEFGIKDGTSDEFQQALKQKVIAALKKDPVWYIAMLPKRFVNMIIVGGGAHGHEIFSHNQDYSYASSYKLKNPNGNIFGYFLWLAHNPYELFVRIVPLLFRGIILLLAAIGLILWRKEWRKILLVFCVFAYGILAHLPLYWEPRYLIPTEFPLLLPAALALMSLGTTIQRRVSQKH